MSALNIFIGSAFAYIGQDLAEMLGFPRLSIPSICIGLGVSVAGIAIAEWLSGCAR